MHEGIKAFMERREPRFHGALGPVPAVPDMDAIRAALTAPGAMFAVRNEHVRGVSIPVFAHRFGSLGEMLEASARFGDRPFIIDGDERVSFSAHLERARALGAVLCERYHVAPGDRVAIFAANRWEWVVSFWAAISIGAVPCCFNGHWSADEWAHARDLTEPSVMIADAPRIERVADRIGALPLVNFDDGFAALLDAGSGAEASPVFRAGGRRSRHAGFHQRHHRPAQGGDDDASRAGSARCKSCCSPRRAQLVAMGMSVPASADVLPPNDAVQLVTSPLFHVAMLISAVLGGMGNGSAMVLMRGRFEETRAIALVERERVSRWSLLGSVAARVAASPALARHDTSSLVSLGVGGATVSPAVQEKLRSAFPALKLNLGMGYSSTEAGSATICHIGGQDFLDHPTSTGTPTVTTQVEIRDPDGRALPDGEYGEVPCPQCLCHARVLARP